MEKISHLFLALLLVVSVMPINYFFGNRFNVLPIQVLCSLILMLFFYRIRFSNVILLIYLFFVVLLLARLDVNSFFQSSITATFIVLALLLLFYDVTKNQIHSFKISILFVIIIGIYSLYNNYNFVQTNGLAIRSKGFGSGTVYSLLSVYSITFIYYLLKRSAISSRIFYLSIIPFIWTLLLTQLRGAILTVLLVLFIVGADKLNKIKWSRVIVILSGVVAIYIYTSISSRFVISEYNDIDHFSSGRSTTQLFILDEIFNFGNYEPILVGFGLNSFKNVVYALGLEFPHLDLLYLLYDGGILIIFIYGVLLEKIYRLFKNKMLFWVFIISSLHTNMVLSPGFLILGKIFDTALVIKSQEKTNRS